MTSPTSPPSPKVSPHDHPRRCRPLRGAVLPLRSRVEDALALRMADVPILPPLSLGDLVKHGADTAYSDGCRCLPCRLAHCKAHEDYSTRKAAGISKPKRVGSVENPRHPHGTISCYTNDRCGCPECRKAWRVYMRGRRVRLKTVAALLIDAEPSRSLILRVNMSGYGCNIIARLARVSTIKGIAAGNQARVRQTTAERIAAVCGRLLQLPQRNTHAASLSKRLAWKRRAL